jgi:hypothetical protein
MTQTPFLAIQEEVPHFGLLTPAPIEQWRAIERFQTEEWRRSDQSRKEWVRRIGGCLDKLGGSLLQVARMRDHYQDMLRSIKSAAHMRASVIGYRGAIACADFEGLLLQGRAALDRLTWFLAGNYHQQCSSFRKLANVLENFQADAQATALLQIIRTAEPWFDSLYAKIESPEALRDSIGHKHAVTEGMVSCFGVSYLDGGRALVLDCEVRLPGEAMPTSIMRESHESARYLSYTVLNALSIVAGIPTLDLAQYDPTWRSAAVTLSDYLTGDPEGSPLAPGHLTFVRHMHPDGAVIEQRNVDPEIYAHALDLGQVVA